MEDKQSRIFLALMLSLGIWFVINYFFFPQEIKKTKPLATDTKEIKETKENKETKPTPEVPKDKTTNVPPKPEIKAIDVKKEFIVTSSFLVEFSSLGGRIQKFYVKNHLNPDGSETLVAKTESDTVEFNGQKYRAIEVSREQGFDFNLISSENEIANSIYNQILFNMNYDASTKTISFETISLDKKYLIRKEYSFFEKENYFKFKLTLTNTGKETLVLSTSKDPIYFRTFGSLGPVKPGIITERDQSHYFRYYYIDGSFKDSIDGLSNEGFFSGFFSDKSKVKKFETVASTGEGIDFLGTGSRYFIAVLDPLNHKPMAVTLDYRKSNSTGVLMNYDSLSLNPSESKVFDYAAYVGVRESEGMAFRDKALEPSEENKTTVFFGLSNKLDKSFNQGITTPFRNGIVWVLQKMHGVIPNFGWCIILFSILFKVVFYPLNQKQAESMKKMQALNPMIQEINEKYASDPQTKQQKIMELYKTHNANPMGGCLPMLVQMPILIALYTAFSDNIELWKTSFYWIHDLSEPDTVWTSPDFGIGAIALNLLPLVMVGAQIIQTRMTGMPTDPNQKTMMYLMPLMMLYFFWSVPSGLTLYWTMQNILSIVQQVYTNKFVDSKKVDIAVQKQVAAVQNPNQRKGKKKQ
ncbi:MAG: membrane protein insertase YidC [Leptospiraceae bacterium]|nr:membrane protein insertase YidC [Leptospiraceae bacterium]